MSTRRASLADAVAASVLNGFSVQAERFGADLHAKAVAARMADPMTIFLLDLFTQQVKRRAQAAAEAHAAGDKALALKLAHAADMAGKNLATVKGAIYD